MSEELIFVWVSIMLGIVSATAAIIGKLERIEKKINQLLPPSEEK